MKKYLERYNGIDYYLYTIFKGDFEISVSEYGATLCTFKYRGKDIIQGFENVVGYVDDVKYMNATIGRVCNRIATGTFILNGKNYHVPINNGPNCLHGGISGFDVKKWNIEENGDELVCSYYSKDGEEGFPGNLQVKVIYRLSDDGLEYRYEGYSDKDTLLNICNHAFFNLDGPESNSILNHRLLINSDKIGMVDEDGCTHNEVMDVTNTPFDFRVLKPIGQDINNEHIQIKNGNGYDHHYIIQGDGLRLFCTYDNGLMQLEVYSDLPGMHLYSANYLDGKAHGKNGGTYPKRSAICFETQFYPNAINCSDHLKPILKAQETMKHTTLFKVKEI